MGANSQNDGGRYEVQLGVCVGTAPVPGQLVTWSETMHSEWQMIHSECDCKADKESVVEKTLTMSRKTNTAMHLKQNHIHARCNYAVVCRLTLWTCNNVF